MNAPVRELCSARQAALPKTEIGIAMKRELKKQSTPINLGMGV